MSPERAGEYATLIRQFLEGVITPVTFEQEYLQMFKNEPSGMSLAEYSILETLFTAVDAFCPDPSLRSEDDLDESQLNEAARAAYSALTSR
jgi:Bacterial self-protective colicin-like immunity